MIPNNCKKNVLLRRCLLTYSSSLAQSGKSAVELSSSLPCSLLQPQYSPHNQCLLEHLSSRAHHALYRASHTSAQHASSVIACNSANVNQPIPDHARNQPGAEALPLKPEHSKKRHIRAITLLPDDSTMRLSPPPQPSTRPHPSHHTFTPSIKASCTSRARPLATSTSRVYNSRSALSSLPTL